MTQSKHCEITGMATANNTEQAFTGVDTTLCNCVITEVKLNWLYFWSICSQELGHFQGDSTTEKPWHPPR